MPKQQDDKKTRTPKAYCCECQAPIYDNVDERRRRIVCWKCTANLVFGWAKKRDTQDKEAMRFLKGNQKKKK